MKALLFAIPMLAACAQLAQAANLCPSTNPVPDQVAQASSLCATTSPIVFDEAFTDSTLCMRLSFKVSPDTAYGQFSDLRMTPRWWGRRVNLDSLYRPVSLFIEVTDSATGRTLYRHSKYFAIDPSPRPTSTTVQVPMPRRAAVVRAWMGMHPDMPDSVAPAPARRHGRLEAVCSLSTRQITQMPVYVRDDAPDYVWLRYADATGRGRPSPQSVDAPHSPSLTGFQPVRPHSVDTAHSPSSTGFQPVRPYSVDTAHSPSSTGFQPVRPHSVDAPHSLTFAFVPEGFTEDEMPEFLRRAMQLDSALMQEAAFARYADRINVVAVLAPSPQSGVTHPSAGVNVNTLFGAHFDSWGIERLLTMPQSSTLGDVLCGLPNTHVMIIANSPTYGGSGSANDYCIGTLDEYWWTAVLIHELGHSFGHLADEYEGGVSEEFLGEDSPDLPMRHKPREPIEPNITNLVDFSGKWQHLIDTGEAGLIEGANYHPHGYWRGCEHCLMRAVGDQHFCAVCTDAIERVIRYYTE